MKIKISKAEKEFIEYWVIGPHTGFEQFFDGIQPQEIPYFANLQVDGGDCEFIVPPSSHYGRIIWTMITGFVGMDAGLDTVTGIAEDQLTEYRSLMQGLLVKMDAEIDDETREKLKAEDIDIRQYIQ